jgi:hypothetical protein
MSDPGSAGYVAAYARVLAEGTSALLAESEGRPLYASFDITENLLLSHSDAARSPQHRWFSILTAGIELMSWDGHWEPRGRSPAMALRTLLTDSFALRAAGDPRAPLSLLPPLCRELQAATGNLHEATVALFCELLVVAAEATPPKAARVESTCRELLRRHERFQQWCDDEGVENRWYVPRPELLWGLLVESRHERDAWLALIEAHFPAAPPLANELRERLLREGAAWRRALPPR